MSLKPLRWLHLSDFHTGKDEYGQRRMYKYILEKSACKIANNQSPDVIFMTGDIANRGLDTEYGEFIDSFFLPLFELFGTQGSPKIYVVPGNHDVDRNQARSVQAHDILSRIPEFLDPTEKGLRERTSLFQRISSFVKADFPNTGGKWLYSAEGAFTDAFVSGDSRIGILGINTAWLSESNNDRHKLCPGKAIIESGLETIKDCDIKIVLGHHPIDWFRDEIVKPIRSLFGKYNVIYLHGHLHKNDSSHERGAGHPYLVMQAGASFQAREDEIWVNRLLWCELDLDNKQLRAQPRQWNRSNQEWSIDGLAYPERYRDPTGDWWNLPLPSSESEDSEVTTVIHPKIDVHLGVGWLVVDAKYLEYYRQAISDEQILQYFDGRVPVWSEALSSKIPRRAIVTELRDILNESKASGSQVILLLGAGGEGKSTAVRQVICDLVESDSDWNVVWRNNPDASLSIEALLALPSSSKKWLIASDDADLIASELFASVKALHELNRTDIHFLMTCRDTDWRGAKGDQLPWPQFTTLSEKRLRGLTLDDAKLIVHAWNDFGARGMGKLSSLTLDEAAARLTEEARLENYSDEGAFLGAMLRTRFGEEIKAHVTELLLRLDERPGPKGSLMNAFAYIAAAHAENVMVLTKQILAEALDCKLRDIKRLVVGPLGEEAAAVVDGQYLLTRHRSIADTAVEVLSKKFYLDFDEVFVDLLRAARKVFESGTYVPNLNKWDYLSSQFFDKGNRMLGIRLARTLLDSAPKNSFFRTQLARLMREAGDPEQSHQLFLDSPEEARNHRYVFQEWAVVQGEIGHYHLNAWLVGTGLSDNVSEPLRRDHALVGLSALSFAFAKLYELYEDRLFIETFSAAAQLLLLVPEGPKKMSQFVIENNRQIRRNAGIADVDSATALKLLNEGVVAAWERREIELPPWVINGSDLSFERLATLLGVNAGPRD